MATEEFFDDDVDEEAEPSASPENPFNPQTLEKSWRVLSIRSPLYDTMTITRPKRSEEVKVRATVRKLAYDSGITPEDLDLWSQNNFYVTAIIQHCSDKSKLDWMELEPDSREEADGLDATVAKIISWLFLREENEAVG